MAGCGDESILKSAEMGREWVKQIGEQLVADLKPHQLVASIFPVPAFFRIWDPKYYTPQLVDLGPIHHSRPQLWESAAVKRRFLEQGQRRRRRRFNSPAGGNIDDDLRNFTDQVVSPLLPAIRAQYDSPLDVLDSTLASLLALDSLFLVELLLGGSCEDDDDEAAADSASILMNDAVMLENQIPLFLLQQPFSALLQGRHSVAEQLGRVYHQLSPLQFLRFPNQNRPRHLLEYLYFQIVGGGGGDGVQNPEEDSSSTTTSTTTTTSFLHILEMAPPGLLKKVPSSTAIEFDMFDLLSDAFQAAGKKILKRAGMFWMVRIVVGVLTLAKTVLRDVHASVPAASLLTRHLDLIILPADHGDLGAMVSFDEQKRTLRLPVLTLRPSCGTLLRNLVAYEYMTKSEDARVLIGYLKLIAGLTRTTEDMNLLRRARVIVADGSDLSALKLFLSQMPPLFLEMFRLHGMAHNAAMDEMEEAGEREAAIDEMKTAAKGTGRKLEAMVAAKDAAAGRTALDSQIQALNCCYNRGPGVMAMKREDRRWKLFGKIAALALMINVATLCAVAILEPVCKYVSLDCLYQWPCCPQGLFSALFTLVTGGFILNLIRAIF